MRLSKVCTSWIKLRSYAVLWIGSVEYSKQPALYVVETALAAYDSHWNVHHESSSEILHVFCVSLTTQKPPGGSFLNCNWLQSCQSWLHGTSWVELDILHMSTHPLRKGYHSTLAISTHVCQIINYYWKLHFNKWNILKYPLLSFKIFFDLEEIILKISTFKKII